MNDHQTKMLHSLVAEMANVLGGGRDNCANHGNVNTGMGSALGAGAAIGQQQIKQQQTPEIEAAMNRLDRAISSADTLFTNLAQRIELVRAPQPPSAETAVGGTPYGSRLGGDIGSMSSRIEALADYMRGVLDSLAV